MQQIAYLLTCLIMHKMKYKRLQTVRFYKPRESTEFVFRITMRNGISCGVQCTMCCDHSKCLNYTDTKLFVKSYIYQSAWFINKQMSEQTNEHGSVLSNSIDSELYLCSALLCSAWFGSLVSNSTRAKPISQTTKRLQIVTYTN